MIYRLIRMLWWSNQDDVAISIVRHRRRVSLVAHDLTAVERVEEPRRKVSKRVDSRYTFQLALDFQSASQAIEQLEAFSRGISAVVQRLKDDPGQIEDLNMLLSVEDGTPELE